MSHGIYCRKCLGTLPNKKAYEEHKCATVQIGTSEEFKVLQLAKSCYYIRNQHTSPGFGTVGSPLLAAQLGEQSLFLTKPSGPLSDMRLIFPEARIVCVKVTYNITTGKD